MTAYSRWSMRIGVLNIQTSRFRSFCDGQRFRTSELTMCLWRRRGYWPAIRSSGGTRAEWNSGHGHWEVFRPVAPVVLEEDAGEWFRGATYSPFMLFVYPVQDDVADRIPAVRHVDGTARIQTVNERQHPEYYALLTEFKKLTGVPVLVNTSFNTLGKPIVCSPRDAIECFWTSPFDALIIGSFVVEKDPKVPDSKERHSCAGKNAGHRDPPAL